MRRFRLIIEGPEGSSVTEEVTISEELRSKDVAHLMDDHLESFIDNHVNATWEEIGESE